MRACFESSRGCVQAHFRTSTNAASGLAPFKSGLGEDAVQTLRFRLGLDLLGARHHHRVHVAGDLAALDDLRGGLQVEDARVGA